MIANDSYKGGSRCLCFFVFPSDFGSNFIFVFLRSQESRGNALFEEIEDGLTEEIGQILIQKLQAYSLQPKQICMNLTAHGMHLLD